MYWILCFDSVCVKCTYLMYCVTGQGQELSKLKLQLQEVIASKSITEDMNNALQVCTFQ